MVRKAALFAAKAHEGAVRKGSNIPYITHPMETAVIVSMMTDDKEVIAAALLHDVIEDAGVSEDELREQFGDRVAWLVAKESEDKSRTWEERKATTIKKLETAERDSKILALGDKLSNLRCTARDYMHIGDKVWERFHQKDPKMQCWYYTGVLKQLGDLANFPAYQEYTLLCDFVFGTENIKNK
ncbi:MAG: bifunctional (p)ppGpp synthetase/guanosine-3',5'-bis(diphosphate) 3'-pyrophosphohydrolase [Lachnospiraceae bacterium]|jgi:guanosine-3',5'-bis(diphosphate) 3'-pyrophosphohydrolase|nr:bifunctional (p)ppGpp synthetase/guanosine-3',5'-bis(diphosphate) 3'-pyrophosphohydrolase [Lachnospiraceae bacterium]MCI9590041.1 bifunctional (p)ppGpp synthetase/guanosine-3',5'-bis(diphosphate) 3'-pyrophosphohydrolase [Lachnospiraceae bacterium]